MIKDIVIDNDCATKHFCNPVLPEYKELILWLFNFDESDPDSNAYLVVNQKLLREYFASSGGARSHTSMPAIIDKLTKEGRLIKFGKKQLEICTAKYIKKKDLNKLQSNKEDHIHIPTVILSQRKIFLSEDQKLRSDMLSIPKVKITVIESPSELNYKGE